MEVNTEGIVSFIDKSRRMLIISISVILIIIFIRGTVNQIFSYQEEIEYLRESIAHLYSHIENKSDASEGIDKYILDAQKELIQIIHETELRKADKSEYNQAKKPTTMKKKRYDFALESVGGSVVSYHDTKLLYECSKFLILIGKCNKISPPEKAIQKTVEPGEAFCFQGNQGSITIKLSCDIRIDSITIDHVERSMTPKLDYSNAPKSISITGLNKKHDNNGHEYGNITFDPSISNSQTFFVVPSSEKYRFLKINVTENNGHQNQTCLYRIQVHGFNDEC